MWKQKEYNREREEEFIKMGKSKLISRLLAQRNSITPENVDKFLLSEYKDLSEPYKLKGIEETCVIFKRVFDKNGRIKVWSDYDADGVIAGSMVKEMCSSLGLNCECRFSDRLKHGYGLNEKSTKEIIKTVTKDKTDLLFILDSGTNNFNEINEIKGYFNGYIIIIDHHLPSKNISTNADALISWHFSKDYNEMCTCGEVYQLIRGVYRFSKKIDPKEYLTFAAIGTIADCSPIVGDNRIIVKNGLTSFAINHMVSSGLLALMKQAKIMEPSLNLSDVAFKISPRINASGRVATPDIVFDLLTERDTEMASKVAEYVAGFNDERKKKQKEIEDEAISCTEYEIKNNRFSHGVLVKSKWHVGIVGIVASRITEEFQKPAIVVGYSEELGVWKGSGRTYNGINLKEVLDICPEIFQAYGGHAGAVGVTLKEDMMDKAADIFNNACKRYCEKHNITNEPCKYFDAKLSAKLITEQTSEIIHNNLYPYCEDNNSEPIFLLPDVTIVDPSIKDGETWRLLTFYAQREIKIEHPFKMFSPKYNAEDIDGRKADIYFSFPQVKEIDNSRFSKFELMTVEIVLK